MINGAVATSRRDVKAALHVLCLPCPLSPFVSSYPIVRRVGIAQEGMAQRRVMPPRYSAITTSAISQFRRVTKYARNSGSPSTLYDI